jgi:hypothetical protein
MSSTVLRSKTTATRSHSREILLRYAAFSSSLLTYRDK